MWPKDKGWTFVNSPRDLIADWIEIDRPNQSMQVFVADKMEGHFTRNKGRLDRLYKWFQLAAISVGSSVILGSVQLAMSH